MRAIFCHSAADELPSKNFYKGTLPKLIVSIIRSFPFTFITVIGLQKNCVYVFHFSRTPLFVLVSEFSMSSTQTYDITPPKTLGEPYDLLLDKGHFWSLCLRQIAFKENFYKGVLSKFSYNLRKILKQPSLWKTYAVVSLRVHRIEESQGEKFYNASANSDYTVV